jgi:poly(3-hydroxybutyrate) depolymerase
MRNLIPLTMIAALLLLGCVCCYGQTPEPQPDLKTATAVEVKYYLSLPEGWTADKSWPILVTLDGSGHDFLGNCRGFMRARGKQPFIIVTPCVSSNGNDPADARAVLAIVKEIQQEKHGQPKFFLTGFSAGGHVTWQILFAHPELLAGVAPAAANFRNRGVSTISDSPDRIQLPIHAFQGDKDAAKSALDDQWNDAITIAREHGYKNLDRTIIVGASHSAFAQEVVAYFTTLLPH